MPKTILLADDSVTIQKVVGISFANEDVVLLTVDNGDDAVAQARESHPDIVLADIVMPGKSGYEVCEALRGDPNLRDIPVLLLSGTFETFDEDRAREVGANGHITKPFEAQSLVDRVNELLEAGTASPPPMTQAPDLAAGSSFLEGSSQSGSEAYDFFDEEMPALAGESARMAETKLIGADGAADSISGQVFDLEPMEERALAAAAAPAMEEPASAVVASAPAAAESEPEPELGDSSDGGFGASFESEEVLASSSAFSFEDNPDLAEAVEAFAHPDSLDAPARPEPDPLTTPVPELAPEAEAFASEPVSDDVLARGISQSFDATEVHTPGPSPAAGDDLYDDFDDADSEDLFADSADGGIPLAEPASVATEVVSEWDEDPESLSQSALEPLADGNTEPPADVVAAFVASPAPAPAPTAIPVEAPVVAEAPAPAISEPEPGLAPVAPSPGMPAELQERMHATLERIAWEAMGDLSERVIKETLGRIESIAWEVIPQMAETMIREELARITQTDDDEGDE